MKHPTLLLALLAACGGESAPTKAKTEDKGATDVMVDQRTSPGYVAVIAPKKQSSLAAEIAARIETVHVRMGAQVKKGDAILTLNDRTIRSELAAANAAAQGARAAVQAAGLEVENSRRQHKLERTLNKQGVSSSEAVRRAQIDMRKAQARRAQMVAEARRSEAEVARLERILDDSTLRAPMDGVVSLLRAREGDLVSAGQVVVRIFAPGDWQLRFAVPSKEARGLEKGQQVEFRVEEAGNLAFPAKVLHVAQELEPPLQLVVVEAEFAGAKDPEGWLKAGRVGRVLLAKNEEKGTP